MRYSLTFSIFGAHHQIPGLFPHPQSFRAKHCSKHFSLGQVKTWIMLFIRNSGTIGYFNSYIVFMNKNGLY